jgi:hypothetical protein
LSYKKPLPWTFSFGEKMSEIGSMSFSSSGILSTDGLEIPCRMMLTLISISFRISKIAEDEFNLYLETSTAPKSKLNSNYMFQALRHI